MKKLHREQTRMVCAVAALICAAVIFTLLFTAYARRFERTLTEENRSRLEEVSEHVAVYMERAVEQQWEELRVAAAASASLPDLETRVNYLDQMADQLNFTYIGLADSVGHLYTTAFSEPQDISQKDYYLAASGGETYITGLKRQIFWDRAVSGVILSIPAPEDTGTAVVAMLSTAKLGADIQVDSFGGSGFSYIIDADGNQVLHARSMVYNNLFQSMANLTFEKGYSLDKMREDIASCRSGMTAYSDLGVEKYAYYRPLRFNDWTVVSFVPKGVVTARTSALSRELIIMCTLAALVFLGLLIIVGLLFLRLESRRRTNRAKSDFLANMSHDMRTPMNAIIGMTAIAETHAEEPGTVRDCMRKIGFSSSHLLGLINDVLDMSRIESGKMTLSQEPFCLSAVLESVENMTFPHMHAKGQHFAVRPHHVKSDSFLGDSLRLSQIFINLLTNAMKFTPEDGRITVDVEELPAQRPDTARFRFTFTDNGIGMKPAFLKELFVPFVRERNSRVDSTEGSGLGMTITKRIVELMGGSIEVKSAEGKGSVFVVTLSFLVDRAAPEELSPPDWRVLVVDGHEDEGDETVRTLKAMGVSAAWVPEIASAVQRLQSEAFQAVFVDRAVYSAKGIAALHCAGESPPVLLLAAYDWEDIRREATKAGIRYFIQKPLLRATLSHALRNAAEPTAEQASNETAIDLSGTNILLIDDNELNLEIARTVLTEAGAAVMWGMDGVDCVSIFTASAEGSFDLILMDIQMPRMNGYEAAKHIRSLARSDASLPILAMSANAYAEDMAAAAEAGMNGYLTKPIDLSVWMNEIQKCL